MARTAAFFAFAIMLTGTAQAGTIFTDDFESTVNTRGWQVYQQISNGAWVTSQGNGIEIQTSGTVVDAHSGNQYIELDSDRRRSSSNEFATSNSAMTRTLTGLSAGKYELEYYYQSRTNRANDNTINVYFGDDGNSLFGSLVDTANGVGSAGWIKYSVPLTITSDDSTRYLTFQAGGIQNTRGGFVDSISLARSGSIPEPLGLGFIGLALAGMARRRRAKISARP